MVAPFQAASDKTLETFVFNQTAHGFTVGQAIVHNGTNYVLANSSSLALLATDVVGQVTGTAGSLTLGANSFRLAMDGEVLTGAGLTAGAPVHASGTTAGAVVSVTQGSAPASAVAQNPVGYAITATSWRHRSYQPIAI
jgi:hypothetical protein